MESPSQLLEDETILLAKQQAPSRQQKQQRQQREKPEMLLEDDYSITDYVKPLLPSTSTNQESKTMMNNNNNNNKVPATSAAVAAIPQAAGTMTQNQRRRFDSSSTTSSSFNCGGDSIQFDNRFEAKAISLDFEVKKSVLSSSDSQQQLHQQTNSMLTSATAPSMTKDQQTSSPFTSFSRPIPFSAQSSLLCSPMDLPLTISLAIESPSNSNSSPSNHEFRIICDIEMVLDADNSVYALTYEIVERMNEHLQAQLSALYPHVNIPMNLIKISPQALENGHIEISLASKNRQPKGCSFDMSQILRKMNFIKTRMCLKIMHPSAYDALVFKLLDSPNKKKSILSIPNQNNMSSNAESSNGVTAITTTTRKYDIQIHPIPEIEDDSSGSSYHGPAAVASLYRESLLHNESIFAESSSLSSSSNVNRNKQQHLQQLSASTHQSNVFVESRNASDPLSNRHSISSATSSVVGKPAHSSNQHQSEQRSSSAKKSSFWSRFFKCGVNCQ